MDAKTERAARSRVNAALSVLGRVYHDGLALTQIDEILKSQGFNEMEPAIFCGAVGSVTEQVGDRTWLTLNWFKMEVTGRYEIVAYVS